METVTEERSAFSPIAPIEGEPGELVSLAWRQGWAAAAERHSEQLEAAVAEALASKAADVDRISSNAESHGYRRAEEYLLSELRAAGTDEKKVRAIVKRLEERVR